jgi:2-dehydropantoate 2-reductase
VNVLIVGAGVIGTVYGAHLGAAGHTVHVLSHSSRTDGVAVRGLAARDVLSGHRTQTAAQVVGTAGANRYDLVLIAVRYDQIARACDQLTGLGGAPTLLFFGNNPDGRSALPRPATGTVRLGFPGVGGVLRDGIAEYVLIRQQPTALQAGAGSCVDEFGQTLRQRGFGVQRVSDMDGWLTYHAAFIACVAAALYRCNNDASQLGRDRTILRLMCAATTEAFSALRREGVAGLPRNLAVLHSPPLKAVAVRYWARTMRSPAGELCFAAHARNARDEMRELAQYVSSRLADERATRHLRQLLAIEGHH